MFSGQNPDSCAWYRNPINLVLRSTSNFDCEEKKIPKDGTSPGRLEGMTTMPSYDPADLEAAARMITRTDVLAQTIEWKKLQAADLISSDELRLISSYDDKPMVSKIAEFRRVCTPPCAA
jgi:hypothetical protein